MVKSLPNVQDKPASKIGLDNLLKEHYHICFYVLKTNEENTNPNTNNIK